MSHARRGRRRSGASRRNAGRRAGSGGAGPAQGGSGARRSESGPGSAPADPARTGQRVTLLVSIVLVAGAVSAVHRPALSAQALSIDDSQFLADNPLVQNPSWDSAWQFLREVERPSTVGGYYLPLSMISLMLDYQMGGRPDDLRPFHRTSLILHVLNTVLVILLLYGLFHRAVPAALTGLLFGVHPLTVEPLAWVGERKTLLATFFALCCLLAYLRHARRGGWRWLALSTGLYLPALLSKPTAAPLPLLLLLLDFWPLRRLGVRAVLEKAPLFALAAVFAAITLVSHEQTAGFLPAEAGPPFRIPLTIGYLIPFYLGKILWPVNLSSVYAMPDPLAVGTPAVRAGLLVSGLLAAGLFVSLRRTRALVTGALFFFVALLPTLGIVRYSWITASDKYVYLPAIGLLAVMAWGVGRLWQAVEHRSAVLRAGIVGLVILVAGAEARGVRGYLRHWRDTETLSTYMLGLTPGAAPVRINLAAALQARGRFDEAIEQLRMALENSPNSLLAHNNLGSALARQGRFDEAIGHFRRVIAARDDYAEAHNNLAAVLLSSGKVEEALEHCRRAIALKPNYPKPYYNLGNVLFAQKKTDEAIVQYRRALRFKRDYAQAHFRLADALVTRDKLSEAVEHYRRGLRIQPDNAEAHDHLGFALGSLGRLDEAVAEHRAALSIRPGYVPAHQNLGQTLAALGKTAEAHRHLGIALQAQGRLGEAGEHFRSALAADPQDAETQNRLGIVLTRLGRFDEALTCFRAAIRLRPEWPAPLNGAAWILAVHPDAAARGPAEAVRLAERAVSLSGGGDGEILDTLAAAYAAEGRYAEAVETGTAALERASGPAAGRLAEAIRRRLALYRAGRPFRETAGGR